MIRLGMLIGELVKDNPPIMIMVTGDAGEGKLVEPTGMKIAENGTGKVIVLTI